MENGVDDSFSSTENKENEVSKPEKRVKSRIPLGNISNDKMTREKKKMLPYSVVYSPYSGR